MMVVGTGMARVVGLGVLLATVGGPVSVMGSRRRSSNNNCNQGKGYCVQWTNHSRNPDSYRTPMNTWECLHGQMAIGLPDEIHTGMQDALGNPMAPTVRKEVEHLPDSQWADDNRESGRCRGCGCQCDVAYKCMCISREIADDGNQSQLTVLYVFACIFTVLFLGSAACMIPLLLQVSNEQEYCRTLIEERKANVAASGGVVPNPMALEAAYSVPVPDVTPGMTVTVVVPDGMEPGQQMAVDPDGPEGPLPPVLVSIPEGLKPGDTMQVTVPAPIVATPVAAAVPYNSMQGLMMMQSRMPGPVGGPRPQIPGAMGRTPGPEFDPPPGYDPNKDYESGPMGCWQAYALMPDWQLEKAANSKTQLYGKYASLPSTCGSIAGVLLVLCVILQPKEGEYYTGCPGDANGAAASVASMAMLASLVAIFLV